MKRFYSALLMLALVLSEVISTNSLAAITEITAEFSYSKTLYGETKKNSVITQKYNIVLAQYFFQLTGVEVNYSMVSDRVSENSLVDVGSGITVDSVKNNTLTTNMGVGLRQAFMPPGSFLIPTLSLGYARQTKNSTTSYMINDNFSTYKIDIFYGEARNDALYGTFALKISLSKLLYLSGSVNTVFKANNYNDAKNNLIYAAGLSWVF